MHAPRRIRSHSRCFSRGRSSRQQQAQSAQPQATAPQPEVPRPPCQRLQQEQPARHRPRCKPQPSPRRGVREKQESGGAALGTPQDAPGEHIWVRMGLMMKKQGDTMEFRIASELRVGLNQLYTEIDA